MAYRAPVALRPQLAASPASRLSDSRPPPVYSGSDGFWSGRSGRASTSSSWVEDKLLRRRGLPADDDRTSGRAFSSPTWDKVTRVPAREGANWMGSSGSRASSSSSSASSSESWIKDKLSGVRPSSLAERAPAAGTKRQCCSPPPSADRSEKKAREDLAMEKEQVGMEEEEQATKEEAPAMEELDALATKEEALAMKEEQDALATEEQEVLPVMEEEQESSAMEQMESGMDELPGIEEEQPATEEKDSVPYFAGPSFHFAPHPSELPFPSFFIHLIHSR